MARIARVYCALDASFSVLALRREREELTRADGVR